MALIMGGSINMLDKTERFYDLVRFDGIQIASVIHVIVEVATY